MKDSLNRLTCFQLDSQRLEVQVAVQVEHGVPEEETDLLGSYGGRVLVDQSTDLRKVPESRT